MNKPNTIQVDIAELNIKAFPVTIKSEDRIKETAELFTPLFLVNEMIAKTESVDPTAFSDPNKTSLDPTCGNGQFIMAILKRKVANGISKEDAIKNTFGADLMVDNICDLIARIIFWKEWDFDIFDDNGEPAKGLRHPGHDDDHSVYWLSENRDKEYKRKYIFTPHPELPDIQYQVCVRKRANKWWLMEVRIENNKEYNCRNICRNFVIADALKYDYEFNGKEPALETPEEKNRRIREEQKARQEEFNKDVLSFFLILLLLSPLTIH